MAGKPSGGGGLTHPDFSLIVLPDTQYYASTYPDTFAAQTQWIADHRSELAIAGVLHMGDLVGEGSVTAQWDVADSAFDTLDAANLPYMICAGNHDYVPNGGEDRVTTILNAYFPTTRFSGKSWWAGGFYETGHVENSYNIQTIGGVDYLFISLEFGPRDAVIAWADGILTTHAEKPAIVFTHAHLAADGSQLTGEAAGSPKTYPVVTNCNDGVEVWDELIKAHDNIIFFLCGHLTPVKRRTDTSTGGVSINQIMINYQNEPDGGSGLLRIMRFYVDARMVRSSTISVTTGVYTEGTDHRFNITYQEV